jgi:predicted dienelactone hydrolase
MRGSVGRSRWLAVCALASMLSGIVAAKESDGESPLPAPTGSYAVGRTHFNWVDSSRAEGASPGSAREIVAWIWYPAVPGPAASRAQWLPEKWQGVSADLVSRGSMPAAAIASVRTHAFVDAAVAASPQGFPVLVFAPGMAMVPLQYSSLVEDLASHGYVVVAIVPTGYSFSVLRDGEVVSGRKPTKLMMSPGLSPQQIAAQMTEEQGRVAQSTAVWSADMRFALTQLENSSSDAASPFKAKLDLGRVGVFGHSQGGASSLQVAAEDTRVRAVVDIDGMVPKELAEGGALSKPALVLMSDTLQAAPPPRMPPPPRVAGASPPRVFGSGPPPMPASNSMNHKSVLRTANPGYLLRLTDSTHSFATDLGVLQLDVKQEGAMPSGPGLHTSGGSASRIDAVRALRITQAYVRAFFGQYLKGQASALLNGPSGEYPEIEIERVSD